MANRVTDKDILRMNEIYFHCKNKAQTAREVGFSASTVAKYLIPNFNPDVVKHPKREIPALNVDYFKSKIWNDLLDLSEEEKDELENLRKEVNL